MEEEMEKSMSEQGSQSTVTAQDDVASQREESRGRKGKGKAKDTSERTWRHRAIGLGITSACLLVAAVAGFTLFAVNLVPAGSAAKVNDFYISEQDVSQYIAAYRSRMSATDDTTYASLLAQSNLSVANFREEVINQIAVSDLIDEKAKELGVTPSDSDVQSYVDSLKNAIAFGNDSTWTATIEKYGMTADQVWNQAKTRLAEQAVYKKAVATPTPTDDQVRSYIEKQKAGATDRHSYRITFTGTDAEQKSKECWARIKAAGKSLTADVFSGFAMTYSSDGNVSSDGGAYGWSDATDLSADYKKVLDGLGQGECSGPVSIGSDGEIDIIYCDIAYTYPPKAATAKMDLDKLPSSLHAYLSDSEAYVLWKADCQTYLSKLTQTAQVTYYPMPENASYDVDMSKATTSNSTSSGQGSSAGSALNSLLYSSSTSSSN